MEQKSGGIFDKVQPSMRPENKPPTVTNLPKQDFKTPMQAAAEMTAKTRLASKAAASSKEAVEEAMQQDAIANINNNAGIGSERENSEMLDELSKITPDDLKRAESMIFNGYAEMVAPIPNFPSRTITVTTTSPEDIDMIDEMIFDLVKANENKETSAVDISDAIVKSSRNMYSISLSYKGMDDTDIHPDKTCQLNIIKKAISSLYNYEAEGDIVGMKKMKDEIKQSIKKRSYFIKKLPTPIIDFISQTKFDFDKKMFDIMNSKNIISK